MKNYIITGILALALTGCQTTKQKESKVTIIPKVNKVKVIPPELPVDPKSWKYKVAKVKDQVVKIPNWYLIPPTDDNAIFSVGTAVTSDLQLSTDMAILSAKVTLADRINGRLSSQTKKFVAQIGTEEIDKSILTELETVTKNVIADVDVAGYRVSDMEVHADGLNYRVFALLKYSDKEANKILLNRLKKDKMLLSKIKSSKAFNELEESVNNQHELDAAAAENNLKIITENS